MTSDRRGPGSKAMIWIGWLLSVLPSLMLLLSGGMKLLKPEDVVKGFEHLGYPEHLALALGVVEIGCTLVYFGPAHRGSGCDPAHGVSGRRRRHSRPAARNAVPRAAGPRVLVWGGLFLRDPRVRRSFLFEGSDTCKAESLPNAFQDHNTGNAPGGVCSSGPHFRRRPETRGGEPGFLLLRSGRGHAWTGTLRRPAVPCRGAVPNRVPAAGPWRHRTPAAGPHPSKIRDYGLDAPLHQAPRSRELQ